MTPEERNTVMSLTYNSAGVRLGDPQEVLRRLGIADGTVWGTAVLRDAIARQDQIDAEMGVILLFVYGCSPDQLDILLSLAVADWHHEHEDITSLLGEIGDPKSVDVLLHLAQWVPEYLDYDEARALAVKAVWALAAIPGPEAEQALQQLQSSPSQIVRENATARLENRKH